MTQTISAERIEEMLACPFCGSALSIRGGVNGYGRCETGGCWVNERAIVVPLDDPTQVAAWNRRSALRTQAQPSEAVAWRPTYEQIIALVEDCRVRRDKAGESSRMMSKWISEGLNALYASPPVQAQMQGVMVKALEWEEVIPGRLVADIYMVERIYLDEWCWKMRAVKAEDWPRTIAGHLTLDAAKAAAQADYERRILSALATPPAPVDGGVTDAMIDAGLAEYSEGGCSGLDQRERREVVTSILNAALTASRAAVAQEGKP